MALQMAAVTTGMDLASKVCQGEDAHGDEMVEAALRSGEDTGVKVVASGTLYAAAKKAAQSAKGIAAKAFNDLKLMNKLDSASFT